MKKITIILIILAFISCEENINYQPKEYSFPEIGFYGLNILNTNTTSLDISDYYSMAVNTSNVSVYVELSNKDNNTGIWCYSVGNSAGWLISNYDSGFQYCKATTDADVQFMFIGYGEMTINIYVDGELLRTKVISWK